MRRHQALYYLELQHNAALHQEIDAKSLLDLDAFIHEADGNLALHAQTASLEHHRQRKLVDRLEEITPEVAMQLHSRIDHDACDLVDFHETLRALDVVSASSASISFQRTS